jgi:hypothetical protein
METGQQRRPGYGAVVQLQKAARERKIRAHTSCTVAQPPRRPIPPWQRRLRGPQCNGNPRICAIMSQYASGPSIEFARFRKCHTDTSRSPFAHRTLVNLRLIEKKVLRWEEWNKRMKDSNKSQRRAVNMSLLDMIS